MRRKNSRVNPRGLRPRGLRGDLSKTKGATSSRRRTSCSSCAERRRKLQAISACILGGVHRFKVAYSDTLRSHVGLRISLSVAPPQQQQKIHTHSAW